MCSYSVSKSHFIPLVYFPSNDVYEILHVQVLSKSNIHRVINELSTFNSLCTITF